MKLSEVHGLGGVVNVERVVVRRVLLSNAGGPPKEAWAVELVGPPMERVAGTGNDAKVVPGVTIRCDITPNGDDFSVWIRPTGDGGGP